MVSPPHRNRGLFSTLSHLASQSGDISHCIGKSALLRKLRAHTAQPPRATLFHRYAACLRLPMPHLRGHEIVECYICPPKLQTSTQSGLKKINVPQETPANLDIQFLKWTKHIIMSCYKTKGWTSCTQRSVEGHVILKANAV